jgi:glycine cleavage system transcriptional repressor
MIIITAVGSDRPGMVSALSSILAEAGCNIEDTSMTRLSGEFAMILIVAPPANLSLSQLQERLAPLRQSHGLFINCKTIDHEQPAASQSPRYILSVYGPDHVGLVAKVSRVLAEQNVNITDLQTRVASGGLVYIMVYEIEIPETVTVDALEAELDRAGQEIGAQLTLRPLEEDVL